LGKSRGDSTGETHGRRRVEADDPCDVVRTLVCKAPGRSCARVIYQNSDPVILAEPSLNLSEVAPIGEIGSQDIDGNTGLRAETVRQHLHASAVARH
jgi:hypothetical protein